MLHFFIKWHRPGFYSDFLVSKILETGNKSMKLNIPHMMQKFCEKRIRLDEGGFLFEVRKNTQILKRFWERFSL